MEKCWDFQCDICSCKKTTKGTFNTFLNAASVWINKPHVANRRLCGSKLLYVSCFKNIGEVNQFIVSDVVKKHDFTSAVDPDHENIHANTDPKFLKSENSSNSVDLSDNTNSIIVVLREIIPKSEYFPKLLEIVIVERDEHRVTFVPLSQEKAKHGNEANLRPTQELAYRLQFQTLDADLPDWSQVNEVQLSWSCDHKETEPPRRQLSSDFMKGALLEKIVSWSHVSDLSTSVTSLQLVPVDKYKDTYTRLKRTYGLDLVKNWPERTDPQKFVYEDIAIAAYLMLIWEEERKKKNLTEKQSFVDLGCGNGLLVYILTREGHKGLGIDIRRRKIWEMFGPDFDLKEDVVIPGGDSLFPKHDWIIGNHSDELTPWIPVIAARSSYKCSFFVLPCCHHDFVGKFSATQTGKNKSTYGLYLKYVEQIVWACGFYAESDTLRIPSTKRICFIGRNRSYDERDETKADKAREEFINKRIELMRNIEGKRKLNKSGSNVQEISNKKARTYKEMKSATEELRKNTESNSHDLLEADKMEYINEDRITERVSVANGGLSETDGDKVTVKGSSEWVPWFKPRVEQTSNNRVNQSTKELIVNKVFQHLLSQADQEVHQKPDGGSWRKAGIVPLGEVVGLFDETVLKQLKSECGGMQSLLRQHSHIFQVTGGQVRFRDFTQSDPWQGRLNKSKKSTTNRKRILCFFHSNHPDGCPRTDVDCDFAHGQSDLQL